MLLTALSVITCVQFVVGGNRSGAELSHRQNGDCWVCLCWLCLCVNLRLLLFGAIVTHTQQWVWLASLWWSDVSAVTELMSVGIPSVWEKEEQVLTESSNWRTMHAELYRCHPDHMRDSVPFGWWGRLVKCKTPLYNCWAVFVLLVQQSATFQQ